MEDNWSTQAIGVLPAGTFGEFMPRDGFREISRFLHFTDNTSHVATTDRAWKTLS
ncbi:hypothetical protein PPTG_23369 [Phytophthora nicotianae INRA-310]|uniref:PiggyBac transposable element-derived protein domain-containing protein n=1 Tax=Phytophthora nicotianae (strain INRA-310) TaxID=761204 RepID=W2Q0L2_PHYN3|nr:hypothetical protein PPTG_23369 [Phytophthora nicotianae INRA-310]ETN06416.1 hypothetical protein PPTG_23369 [Phytophthora nicotianae INRA-310]